MIDGKFGVALVFGMRDAIKAPATAIHTILTSASRSTVMLLSQEPGGH